MTTNRKLGAVALLSLGFCISADAGVIKSSFTATETKSYSSGNPTSSSPTTKPTIKVAIYQTKRSVSKIVVTETLTKNGETSREKTTFTPFGSSYSDRPTLRGKPTPTLHLDTIAVESAFNRVKQG